MAALKQIARTAFHRCVNHGFEAATCSRHLDLIFDLHCNDIALLR